MGKIIILVFILVLGGLIYRLLKPVLNNKPSVKYTEEGVKSFTELKEELEFKVAFYKKKVEDGHKEAAELEARKIKILADADAYEKQRAIQANGALEQKLDAYVKVQTAWAEAFKNYSGNIVPLWQGSGSGNAVNGWNTQMDFMYLKAMKDLSLDMSTKK